MNNKHSALEFILTIMKCFFILIVFGVYLPKIVDSFLFFLYKSNVYHNSMFVNYVVDKNGKLLYNYIYILKLMLNT
jgi:hypothetical protein